MICCQLHSQQLPLVNRFYKQCRYPAKAGRGDEVWVLKDPAIVAAVKLLSMARHIRAGDQALLAQYWQGQEDWLFLRAMCVAPERRSQGLGSELLQALKPSMAGRVCYCFPFSHLQEFYAQCGFQLYPIEQLPAFVGEAFQRYRQQGRDICLMVRRPYVM